MTPYRDPFRDEPPRPVLAAVVIVICVGLILGAAIVALLYVIGR